MEKEIEMFIDLSKTRGVIGLPAGMSVGDLPEFLEDQSLTITIEFGIVGDTIARAYWVDGDIAGGCIQIPSSDFIIN